MIIVVISLLIGWILSVLFWFGWGEFCYDKWSNGRDFTPKALIFTLLGGVPMGICVFLLLILTS